MKKCPFCAEEIQDDAIKCKHCGSWLDGRSSEQNIETKEDQKNNSKKIDDDKKKKSGCFQTGCLVLLVVIAGLFLIGRSSSDSSNAPDNIAAEVYAELLIAKKLKSPSTAKFSNSHNGTNVIILKNDPPIYKYRVSGWVDSQNSFGAMIRNNYTCTVEYNKSADTWRLEDLQLE